MSRARRVTVLLHGGFGNQLFQFAAAESVRLAGDHDCEILLVSYGSEWGPNHPDLDRALGIPIRYPDRRLRSTIPGIVVREDWRDVVSNAMARSLGAVRRVRVAQQIDPYGAGFETGSRDVVLDGFFQHRDWWLPSWRSVADRILEVAPAGLAELRAERRTALKLRRSDYLGRGIVLTDDYYREALRALGIRDREVTVICEDPEAIADAERLLREVGCTVRSPEPLTGDANIDDFWHLAAARTQVLANSSYCWWAAAAASAADPGAEVAYPDPWLPNDWGSGRLPDMGLRGWQRVAAGFV